MKVLLDVNLLLAIGNAGHSEHQLASSWLASLVEPQVLTCAISEPGFVRVSLLTRMQPSVADAVAALERGKAAAGAVVVADQIPARTRPAWVHTPAQIADGHLVEPARSLEAKFATLDRGIPGALLGR